MEVKIGLDTSANLKLECIQFSNATGNPAFLPDAMICECAAAWETYFMTHPTSLY